MRYIKSVKIELDAIPKIDQDFELGDLTIFIGKTNSGKTRILNEIVQKFNKLVHIKSDFPSFRGGCSLNGIHLNEEYKKILRCVFVQSYRGTIPQIDGLSGKLSRSANSLKIIDPNIKDFGTNEVEFLNGQIRTLSEQGSGVHNKIQILDKLHSPNDLVLIDEPEISQFPYGKIEVLKNVIEELENKQVIMATHDPTLINAYLIKKLIGDNDFKVILYSYCGDKFKKIEFDDYCDPEIHAGYLSQTYSGKPVHLIVEGKTEFYAFQALLNKFGMYYKIPNFPNFLNKISLSFVAGGQWPMHCNHLPNPKYYDIFMLLDGEYSEEIKKLPSDKFEIMDQWETPVDDKINVITLSSENFDKAFKKVFGKEFAKPFELSMKIWSLTEKEFKAMDFKDIDMRIISGIIRWALYKSGVKSMKVDPENELLELIKRLANKEKPISIQKIKKLMHYYSSNEIEVLLNKLKRKGEIFEPKRGFLQNI